MRFLRAATTLLLFLTLAAPAAAKSKAGVKMPDTITVAKKRLTLNGLGLREATFFKVDVYVAGLYVENVSSDARKLINANETKRLVLYFLRDVDRSDITKAWSSGFKGNAMVPMALLKERIDKLNGWMPAFKRGDMLTFTILPDKGVVVHVNTTRKGVVTGEDFSQSLLAIWIGPKPPTGALKRGLLGKH